MVPSAPSLWVRAAVTFDVFLFEVWDASFSPFLLTARAPFLVLSFLCASCLSTRLVQDPLSPILKASRHSPFSYVTTSHLVSLLLWLCLKALQEGPPLPLFSLKALSPTPLSRYPSWHLNFSFPIVSLQRFCDFLEPSAWSNAPPLFPRNSSF